jgi:hypothetical protein
MILARYLRREGLREFNASEVRRYIGGAPQCSSTRAACQTSEEVGLIRQCSAEPPGTGMRPT